MSQRMGRKAMKCCLLKHDVVVVQIYSRCGYLQMTKPVKIPAWIEEGLLRLHS